MLNKRQKIKNIPTHIAFIMDGNRRWATKRGLNKMLGHKQGAIALKNIVEAIMEIKEIKYASFFAFSTENWNRDQREIDYLFELIYQFVEENEDKYKAENVKVVFIGDLMRFPEKMRNIFSRVMKETENNTGLVVNLAVSYGGQDDIVHAVNNALENGEKKITIENLKENLYSYPSPDIDLMVRTSGEMRVSNFMLFQMAYSELYFTKTYWPDFNKKCLLKAIYEFSNRNRRFGGK